MKKNLGLKELLNKDVPPALDGSILAYAAISQQRHRKQRKLRIVIPAAAAAMLMCAAGIFKFNAGGGVPAHTTAPQLRQMNKISNTELLAMNDFSAMEQDFYTINQLTEVCENSSDSNYI